MNNQWVIDGLRRISDLKARWPAFQGDRTLDVPDEVAGKVIDDLVERLTENYPFWNPCYAGQMLKPPHDIASLAYFLTQQINPNNHALDGGPATAKMEIEVVADLARMFGFQQHLGHLTSSGTLANLEALWVAQRLHPDHAIAFSSEAHYTHRRMCEVLGARTIEIGVDSGGRLDPADLRTKLAANRIGTVVVTPGSTALGAVDPIHEVAALRSDYDFRIHVDAAYGGFFKLLASAESTGALTEQDSLAFNAIPTCDSIVVDPHKHGLQPYGCGSVIFREPAVGRFYKHDSPYTYFTSNELHLGEISLECSRAGAAAAAFWATLKCFPLESATGLGAVMRKTRAAAVAWETLIRSCKEVRLVTSPSLDIVAFFPTGGGLQVSAINELTGELFTTLMNDRDDPIYLAKLNLKPALLNEHQDLVWDSSQLTVIRSVLMKPEHLDYVPHLHKRVVETARSLR